MVHSLEFKPVHNPLQSKLKRDLADIRSSDNMLVFADKTTNLYSMHKDQYKKLLHENVTKSYKKSDATVVTGINSEAADIAKSLKLEDKMECYAQKEAFITLKDHKENFRNNTKCRLINPAKSEVGIVSKKILERVNKDVKNATQVNQWRNTSTVIKWFSGISNKKRSKFVKFDIVDFYPSIAEELLDKALQFAQQFTNISEEEIKIIKHARKALLFDNSGTWKKKGLEELFDVTMGSFDGAEVCEIVGLFLLFELAKLIGKENVGLYRDDGLGILKNCSGPKSDRIRKDIIKLFKNEGLAITIEINLKVTDFLDVTFDLPSNKFYPFRKPNDKPLYVNAHSNHPESIIKQLPEMINKRVNELSCNREEFCKAKVTYESALSEAGHKYKMQYNKVTGKRKNRPRKIIWFNPPFSLNVKTNIGKAFLKLIEKHFPKHHKLSKIFNKNSVKLSYSCMDNMASLIQSHNSRVLQEPVAEQKLCNCTIYDCPLDRKCLTPCIVYKATVTSDNKDMIYFGLVEKDFKQRWRDHKQSFKDRKYQSKTELAKHIWSLQDQKKPFSIKWDIAAKASPTRAGSRRCDLCITEKKVIVTADPLTLLNKRDELVSCCRHRRKFLLKNFIT